MIMIILNYVIPCVGEPFAISLAVVCHEIVQHSLQK